MCLFLCLLGQYVKLQLPNLTSTSSEKFPIFLQQFNNFKSTMENKLLCFHHTNNSWLKPRVKPLTPSNRCFKKAHVYLRLAAVWRPSLPAQREQLASAACQHKQKPGANGNLVTEVLKQDLRPWNVNCKKKRKEITESSLNPPTIRVRTLIAA